MITVDVAIGIGVAICLLTLYTFLDLENRIYGNVIACLFASLLCFILALFLFSGNIVSVTAIIDSHNTTSETINNITTTTESYSYVGAAYSIVDPTIAWICVFVGIGLFLIFIMLVLDAWYEKREEREGLVEED